MTEFYRGIADTHTIAVCPFCKKHNLNCSICGADIYPGENVECRDGMTHICGFCME